MLNFGLFILGLVVWGFLGPCIWTLMGFGPRMDFGPSYKELGFRR